MEVNMENITIELTENQRAILVDIIEFYQTNQSFPRDGELKEQVDNLWWLVTQAA
jgi:hypothetical protein